jgi:hypothetical protein
MTPIRMMQELATCSLRWRLVRDIDHVAACVKGYVER